MIHHAIETRPSVAAPPIARRKVQLANLELRAAARQAHLVHLARHKLRRLKLVSVEVNSEDLVRTFHPALVLIRLEPSPLEPAHELVSPRLATTEASVHELDPHVVEVDRVRRMARHGEVVGRRLVDRELVADDTLARRVNGMRRLVRLPHETPTAASARPRPPDRVRVPGGNRNAPVDTPPHARAGAALRRTPSARAARR